MLIPFGVSLLPCPLRTKVESMCVNIFTHIHVPLFICLSLPASIYVSTHVCLSTYLKHSEFTLIPSISIHHYRALTSHTRLPTLLIFLRVRSPHWVAHTTGMPSSLPSQALTPHIKALFTLLGLWPLH